MDTQYFYKNLNSKLNLLFSQAIKTFILNNIPIYQNNSVIPQQNCKNFKLVPIIFTRTYISFHKSKIPCGALHIEIWLKYYHYGMQNVFLRNSSYYLPNKISIAIDKNIILDNLNIPYEWGSLQSNPYSFIHFNNTKIKIYSPLKKKIYIYISRGP